MSKSGVSFLLGTIVFMQAFNLQASDKQILSLLDLSLEKLGDIQVYTANRGESTLEEAPSTVSVITQEEIQQRGYQTLADILERVPGFYVGRHGGLELIGSRGFIQDRNTNYLLLVDGHSMNNGSMGSVQLFPILADVQKIEIIRGPGATLWGSSALMGIIHIYTKSAADLDGKVVAGMNYEGSDKRYSTNIQYGEEFDNADFTVSLKYMESDASYYDIYKPGVNEPELMDDKVNNHFVLHPSYDIYIKGRVDNFYLLARDSSLDNGLSSGSTADSFNKNYQSATRSYLDLSHKKSFNSWELDSKFYYNSYGEETLANKTTKKNIVDSYGVEFIARYDFLNTSSILSGITYQQYRPQKGSQFLDYETEAVFSEITYSEIEDWNFILGGRIDKSNHLADSTEFIPRASVFHRLSDDWSIKYNYQTGFVRPAYDQAGGFVDNGRTAIGAQDGQKTISHDIQLTYNGQKTFATMTLFNTEIRDYITWIGHTITEATPNEVGSRIWNANAGDINSYGLELEFTHQLDDMWKIYGNYSFTNSEYDDFNQNIYGVVDRDLSGARFATLDGTMTDIPKQMWNLGVDINFNDKTMINIHYRGNMDKWVKWDNSPSYKELGTSNYIDINLHNREAFIEGIKLNIFVKNVFDNQDYLPGGDYGAYGESLGRKYGFDIAYSF